MEREEYVVLRQKIENDLNNYFAAGSVSSENKFKTNLLSTNMEYVRIGGLEAEGGEESSLIVAALFSLGIAFSYICYWHLEQLVLCQDLVQVKMRNFSPF